MFFSLLQVESVKGGALGDFGAGELELGFGNGHDFLVPRYGRTEETYRLGTSAIVEN